MAAAAAAASGAAGAAAGPTYTAKEAIGGAVARARAAFDSNRTRPLEWRYRQLRAIGTLMERGEAEIMAALRLDLGRPDLESVISEVAFVKAEVKEAVSHLASWVANQPVTTPPVLMPGSSYVKHDPLGVVAIIAPWNFPFQLSLGPLVAAVAAGNAAVIKPSELAPASAVVLERLVNLYLDTDAIKVVQGAVAETTELLRQRFDHIFYTGNGEVAKHIMRAATEHLTPVTLELGGKSPTIVHNDADLELAAARIVVNKFFNAGQVCLAPDYLLVQRDVRERLVEAIKATITRYYGDNPATSTSFGRIISDRHFARVKALMDGGGGRTLAGGGCDAATKYIAPTLIADPAPDSALMTQEIFGPLLPVVSYGTLDEAIAYVNARPKPLGLYIFTSSSSVSKRVLDLTSSGGAVVNDCVVHAAVPGLPFGGVGASGMGAYHGKWGFDALTHRKAVFDQVTWVDPGKLRYPPYTPAQTARLAFLFSNVPALPRISLRTLIDVGLLAAVIGLAIKLSQVTSK